MLIVVTPTSGTAHTCTSESDIGSQTSRILHRGRTKLGRGVLKKTEHSLGISGPAKETRGSAGFRSGKYRSNTWYRCPMGGFCSLGGFEMRIVYLFAIIFTGW